MRTTVQFHAWLDQCSDDLLSMIHKQLDLAFLPRPETPDDLPEGMSYEQLRTAQKHAHEWLLVTLDYPFNERTWETINCIQGNRAYSEQERDEDEENRGRIEQPEPAPYDPDDDIPF